MGYYKDLPSFEFFRRCRWRETVRERMVETYSRSPLQNERGRVEPIESEKEGDVCQGHDIVLEERNPEPRQDDSLRLT